MTSSSVVYRFGLFLALLVTVSSGCLRSEETGADDGPEITNIAHHATGIATDKVTYALGEPVTVSWSEMPGNPYDWIAIRTAGDADDNTVVAWAYTGGVVLGAHTFPKGISVGGTYEARAYAGGTYVPLAVSIFTVDAPPPPPAPSISTNKTNYALSESITVSWNGMPGNPNDWIALRTAGDPDDTSVVAWAYTGGTLMGSHTFTKGISVGGTYEARAYAGGTYVPLAVSTFNVLAVTTTITTNKTTYAPSEQITVSWTGAPTNPYTWVALTAAGAPHTSSSILRWGYASGQVDGSLVFAGLPTTNSYEARMYRAGTYDLVASTPFSVSTSTGTCTPSATPPVFGSLVTGELAIGTAAQYTTVPLVVPLEQSILFTSVRENEPSPVYGSVMCRLHPAETVTIAGQPVDLPAGITCTRNTAGTDTGSGQITVRYTVATFTSGVSVQRGVANTGITNPTTVTLSPVNASESFVLLGGVVNNGTGWGNNEFVRAELSSSSLELRTAVAGTRVAWQVVSMSGASVQRGSTTLSSTETSRAVAIATAPSGSLVLASYTTDNSSALAATLMLQARLADPTTVSFSRQASGSNLSVSWEVVSLPFATYSGTATFTSGQSTASVPVSGSNFTSDASVALASTQSLFGPSSGSTSYVGSAGDLVGEAAFTLAAGTSSIEIQRATSQAGAVLPWTVIDFAHDCNGQ